MSEPVHTSETPATGTPETPASAPEQATTPPQPPSDPTATDGSEHLGDPGKRALDRMKAERDEAQRKLREFQDREMTDLQKAQRDREEALTRLQVSEREALRNRVALNKGLDPKAASFLNGATEEELLAQADDLIAWRGNVPPTTPRPDPGQGPRPTTPESEAEADYFRFYPDEAPRRA